MKSSYGEKIFKYSLYGIVFILTLSFVFPFVWALYSSFRPEDVVNDFTLQFGNLTTGAYSGLIAGNPMIRWYMNSLIVSVTVITLGILMNAACGYALARIDFKGNNALFMLVLSVMMIPGQVLMVPTYILISKFGMLDSLTGLIIPFLFSAMNVFMFRQFYLNFPKDLEESAFIDGLGRVKIFFKIALPVAKAPVVTLIILNFIGNWNSFVYPNLLISSSKMYTLPVGLASIQNEYKVPQNEAMAASMLITIPLFIFYMFMQKKLSQGIATTGVK